MKDIPELVGDPVSELETDSGAIELSDDVEDMVEERLSELVIWEVEGWLMLLDDATNNS